MRKNCVQAAVSAWSSCSFAHILCAGQTSQVAKAWAQTTFLAQSKHSLCTFYTQPQPAFFSLLSSWFSSLSPTTITTTTISINYL